MGYCNLLSAGGVLLLILFCRCEFVEGISRCNQHVLAPSILRYPSSIHRRIVVASNGRGRRRQYERTGYVDPFPAALPVARKKKASVAREEPSRAEESDDPFAVPMTTQEIYASLGPVGRCVAGTVEIAVSVVMEYVSGFMGGLTIGTLAGLPGFAFRSMDKEKQYPFMQEISQRFGRMNSRSFRWAKTWGSISATFGGSRVAIRVIRGGKEVSVQD